MGSGSHDAAAAMAVPAPHGLRAAAFLVDAALVVALFLATPRATPWILLPSLFVAYTTVLVWLSRQTVGKALFGLRIQRIGRHPTFLWALGRSSLGYFAADVVLLGSLAALFDGRHRAVHDRVFASEVVYLRGTPRQRLNRLVTFAERSEEELEQRKQGSFLKPLFVLKGLWELLRELADLVGKALDFAEKALGRLGAPTSSAASAPTAALPAKTALLVVVGTTAATAATVTAVPQFRNALVAPHGGEAQRETIRLSDVDEADCIESLPRASVVPVASVVRVDCDLAHEGEVYAVIGYPSDDFPGESKLHELGREQCPARFEEYVGRSPTSSALKWTFLAPHNETTWAHGIRHVTCLLYRESYEPQTESVRGRGL